MSHTKGPWGVVPDVRYIPGDGYSIIAEKRRFDIVRLDETGEPYFPDTICTTDDDNEDNAFLIAAAPKLLEACEFAIETLREWVEFGRAKSELNTLDGTPIILTEADCCQFFEEIERVLFQVGRAHAKAKGEANGR